MLEIIKNKKSYKLFSKVDDQNDLRKLFTLKTIKEFYLNEPQEVLKVDDHYLILRKTTSKLTSYTHLTHIDSDYALDIENIQVIIKNGWFVSKLCIYEKEGN